MAKVVKTSDGYTFYRQSDGTYKDTRDGKDFDMSFDDLKQIMDMDPETRIIEKKSGGLVRKGRPKLAKKGWR